MDVEWHLMSENCITSLDRNMMSDFILNTNKFTKGEKVLEFEKEWSKWQGCKYSVFVSSGSSANLILVDGLNRLCGKGTWVCQATTWTTNVSPIIQLGKILQLCDTSLDNFGPDLNNLEYIFKKLRPKYFFITHILGFPAYCDEIHELCNKYNVILAEDCCESHGATYNSIKVGNFGIGSTFSFYYGHHMTTIEGGMVCTNNYELYKLLLLLRSHGMLRELPKNEIDKNIIDNIDPKFTFLIPGYNVRNTEINAVLGMSQLERLNDNIKVRNKNLNTFLQNLDSYKYKVDYNTKGISNFSLPIFCKNVNIQMVKNILYNNKIEFRPLIAGNLYNHPMLYDINQMRFDNNANVVHDNCIYVGNHQDINENDILKLCNLLNSIKL